MTSYNDILDGTVVNAPRGRFSTPRARAEALLLNERGWHCCVNNHWHDQVVGEECMDCGKPMRAERRPDKGSVFAQVYQQWLEAEHPWFAIHARQQENA